MDHCMSITSLAALTKVLDAPNRPTWYLSFKWSGCTMVVWVPSTQQRLDLFFRIRSLCFILCIVLLAKKSSPPCVPMPTVNTAARLPTPSEAGVGPSQLRLRYRGALYSKERLVTRNFRTRLVRSRLGQDQDPTLVLQPFSFGRFQQKSMEEVGMSKCEHQHVRVAPGL